MSDITSILRSIEAEHVDLFGDVDPINHPAIGDSQYSRANFAYDTILAVGKRTNGTYTMLDSAGPLLMAAFSSALSATARANAANTLAACLVHLIDTLQGAKK